MTTAERGAPSPTRSAGNTPEPQDMTRIVLRPLASSLPLGFLAFGAGTILLTALELKWVPLAQDRQLMILVLAFVTPLEILAGVLAFLARDSGAATGLTMLGAAWAGTAITVLTGTPGALSKSLGIFLLLLSANMLVLSAASVRGKPAFGALLAIGAARFALTGIYQAGLGGASTQTAAGWIGLPLAVLSLYGGLALLLEEGAQRTILPTGRRGRAKNSLEKGIGTQIAQAAQEAGVRRQL